jgi:hypothetical protein
MKKLTLFLSHRYLDYEHGRNRIFLVGGEGKAYFPR